MRKTILPLSLAAIALLLAFMPVLKAGSKSPNLSVKTHSSSSKKRTGYESSYKTASGLLYDSLDLGKLGLSYQALECAYKGYLHLQKKAALENQGILTICDFSQPSSNKRMYVLDVKHYKVLVNTYVAHGKNSGLQYAKKFSNKLKSLQSSLGFFVTGNTYSGKHGLSLRLDGLEKGFNDKAEKRAIVVHGADYIGSNCLKGTYMGRSFGCPAVPRTQAPKIIDIIKNGSCLFIYHPSANYLHGSKILNG